MKKKTRTRTLNVKMIQAGLLSIKWDTQVPVKWLLEGYVYIQCNAKGEVNYEKNSVYLKSELKDRKHKIF